MRIPAERAINRDLQLATGQEVLGIDVLPLEVGASYALEFDAVNSPWRQGVLIGTSGQLEIDGQRSSQFVLWSDSAPPGVTITCLSTETGRLTVYNVWDSGRGYTDMESHSATSGMLRDDLEGGTVRYRCQDISVKPVFDRLTFRIRPLQPGPLG